MPDQEEENRQNREHSKQNGNSTSVICQEEVGAADSAVIAGKISQIADERTKFSKNSCRGGKRDAYGKNKRENVCKVKISVMHVGQEKRNGKCQEGIPEPRISYRIVYLVLKYFKKAGTNGWPSFDYPHIKTKKYCKIAQNFINLH